MRFSCWEIFSPTFVKSENTTAGILNATPPEWRDTFVIWALRIGLRSYFKERVKGDPRHVQGKRGRPMLDFFLEPGHTTLVSQYWTPGLEMINLVLEKAQIQTSSIIVLQFRVISCLDSIKP